MTRAMTPAPSVERLAAALLPPDGGGRLRPNCSTGSRRRRGSDRSPRRTRPRSARSSAALGTTTSLRDVRAELRAAHLLLADKRIELAFEAYGSGKRRARLHGHLSRDADVQRRGHPPAPPARTCRRRRADRGQAPPAAAERAQRPGRRGGRRIRRRGSTSPPPPATLRARADARDDAFFAAYGLTGTRAFNERFLRLGAVITWSEGAATAGDRAAIWSNASARIALDPRATDACLRCFRADA